MRGEAVGCAELVGCAFAFEAEAEADKEDHKAEASRNREGPYVEAGDMGSPWATAAVAVQDILQRVGA
jgi:hypothetical protein